MNSKPCSQTFRNTKAHTLWQRISVNSWDEIKINFNGVQKPFHNEISWISYIIEKKISSFYLFACMNYSRGGTPVCVSLWDQRAASQSFSRLRLTARRALGLRESSQQHPLLVKDVSCGHASTSPVGCEEMLHLFCSQSKLSPSKSAVSEKRGGPLVPLAMSSRMCEAARAHYLTCSQGEALRQAGEDSKWLEFG